MRVFGALREAIRLAQRDAFRICHFSVQHNHVHMLVEATSREALSQGVQGLAIRLARAVNRTLQRKGEVWGDRYHRRDLATPREVRHALVYVLLLSPRTWLLGAGWRRLGLIASAERPRGT